MVSAFQLSTRHFLTCDSVLGAPYQNFWPQPMTYLLPQPAGTPGPVLVPPGAPQTPNATMMQSTPSTNSHNPSTNSSATGRRSSPPSNNHHNHHHHHNNNHTSHSHAPSQSTTAIPLQTFSSSVPSSDNTPGSGPQALYAPVYPNVLPYNAQTAGFYQPLPHHPQTNTTIISSVIPQPNAHPAGTLPSTPHSFQSNAGHVQAGEVITHFPFSQSNQNANGNVNPASTPQSAPSTPLSLTTVQPSFKNPPLFATPPIITSTISAPVHITHYEEKKHYSSYAPKKYQNNGANNGSGILNTPQLPHNNTKPSSNPNPRPQTSTISGYQGNTVKKSVNYNGSNNINSTSNPNSTSNHTHSEDTNSLSNSNMVSNYTSNRLKNSSNRDQTSVGSSTTTSSYPPKSTYVSKSHQHQSYSTNNISNNNGSNSSNSPNSNDNSEVGKYVPQQHRGPSRVVPPSLDLKRNNSNTNVMTNNYHHHRSTPSTNSTESNNSPNSITSYDHSRSYHYTTQYPVTSGGAHFYRGGSAGAINVSANINNNPGEGAPPNQTFFPFNIHSQNPGTSTPLLDSCHQLIGYNNPMGGGMYVKLGPSFTFANVS